MVNLDRINSYSSLLTVSTGLKTINDQKLPSIHRYKPLQVFFPSFQESTLGDNQGTSPPQLSNQDNQILKSNVVTWRHPISVGSKLEASRDLYPQSKIGPFLSSDALPAWHPEVCPNQCTWRVTISMAMRVPRDPYQ